MPVSSKEGIYCCAEFYEMDRKREKKRGQMKREAKRKLRSLISFPVFFLGGGGAKGVGREDGVFYFTICNGMSVVCADGFITKEQYRNSRLHAMRKTAFSHE